MNDIKDKDTSSGLTFDSRNRQSEIASTSTAREPHISIIGTPPLPEPTLEHRINHAPEVLSPLNTQTLTMQKPWHFQIPANTVIDSDGDRLTYMLSPEAPEWLNISGDGHLSGTPTEFGDIKTEVLAIDPSGEVATLDLNLAIAAPHDAIFREGLGFGTLGDDELIGSNGNDTLHGMTGHDRLYGGEGDDSMFGGFGNDMLYGGNGNDYLDGGFGHDTLIGGDGNDTMKGGGGDDIMRGGRGDDYMEGGDGHDTYIFKAGDGHDVIRETRGSDTLVLRDFTLDDLLITHQNGDLTINFIDNTRDSITIKDWDYESWFHREGQIEVIKLKDVAITGTQLEQMATAMPITDPIEHLEMDHSTMIM